MACALAAEYKDRHIDGKEFHRGAFVDSVAQLSSVNDAQARAAKRSRLPSLRCWRASGTFISRFFLHPFNSCTLAARLLRFVSQLLKFEFIYKPAPDIEENFDLTISAMVNRCVHVPFTDGPNDCAPTAEFCVCPLTELK